MTTATPTVSATPPAYDELARRMTEASLLGSSASLLGWDQETMMPPRGLPLRAKQLAQLARMTHGMRTAPEVGEALAACEDDAALVADPHGVPAVNVREWRRQYDKATKLPGELVEALALTSAEAKADWQAARQASDFARFLPSLTKLVGLLKEKAQAAGVPADGEAWDALADDYEPGMRAAGVAQVFTPLRESLVELIGDLRDNGTPPDDAFLKQRLPIEQQEAFVREVAGALGFDFERGRLDRSTHPFCGGTHCNDVRMTTRFRDDNLPDALSSTMHESGHGLYEQGLPEAYIGTPRGQSVSLSIHESQSRMWENQVGRSRSFWSWAHPRLATHFGDAVSGYSADAVYAACNRVEPGFIRVEADEATYNLHIMIRFEIERAIMSDTLDLADLPEAWNARYKEYLGVDVPDDAHGCLQDIHWSMGAIGYFPTYTMGNLYCAQFYEAASAALPGLDEGYARGDFAPLLGWLREHIHGPGKTYSGPELVERVTGQPLSSEPLMRYLGGKLRAVYGL